MCLGGEAGWDGESGRYKKKKILDIIEVFFSFLKVSKYFTFPLPLNNVSCKWSMKGAASTGCVALGPEVCALLPRRQSLKAEFLRLPLPAHLSNLTFPVRSLTRERNEFRDSLLWGKSTCV